MRASTPIAGRENSKRCSAALGATHAQPNHPMKPIHTLAPTLLFLAACAAPARETPRAAPEPVAGPGAEFALLVPGCTAELAMQPIPAGGGVGAFWMSSTEITWDMYDAFVFAMERPENEPDPPDAFSRPSKPYILMDRGFGHRGYPVISVSFRGANEFCRWLSARTGRPFRLPTGAEWEHAARAGAAGDAPANLEEVAWFRANSTAQNRPSTHPVGTKAPNAWGLHDVHGNAAEWTVGADGTGVLRGGSFRDRAADLAFTAQVPDRPEFNATDPQIPRSVWWLADGPFAGFRVVCDPAPPARSR